ncbi:hypothetical protein GQ457_15G029930 [Hibiscus cannabinus]
MKKALAERHSRLQLNTYVSWPISRWFAPPVGWVKLNSDGACRSVTGHSSCGGGFRNSEGVWLHGFSKFIGCCSILEAELWGICMGLSLAWDRGFRCIMVESDYIRRLCSQNWQVSFHHVLRTGNIMADSLAKLAESSSFDILHFVNPPLYADRLLQEDCSSPNV